MVEAYVTTGEVSTTWLTLHSLAMLLQLITVVVASLAAGEAVPYVSAVPGYGATAPPRLYLAR